ncbi:MAG: hypothetical protein WCH05_04260 [Chlorobiaceae bacterium]
MKKIILDVENESGGPRWAKWESAQEIIDTYAPFGLAFENSAVTERFVLSVLERAIESDGKTLPGDCGLYDLMILESLVSSFADEEYRIDLFDRKSA